MSKAVFITGAASGIGRATALLFAKRGWFVGLYDVDGERLAKVRREVEGEGPRENNEIEEEGPRENDGTAGGNACDGRLDVTDLGAFRAAVESFGKASGGRMDVLFQSAGLLDMGLFPDIAPERASRMIDVNVKGVVNGVYAALPLLERSQGTIVTMGSASGVYGTPELAVYSATKFFVRGLTEALEIELRKRRVRVLDVMPLYVDTPMVHGASHQAASMKSLGVKLRAEDVAQLVADAAESPPPRYRPHIIPDAKVRALRVLSGVAPTWGRYLQKRFAGL